MLIKRSSIIDVKDNGGRGIMKILDHQGLVLWEKGSTPPHPEPQFDDHDPLTIVKTDEGEGTVMFSLNNTNKHVMYRTDENGDWEDITVRIKDFTLSKGEYVQFASDDTISMGTISVYSQIVTISGTYEVYGNVQSLYNNSDTVPDYGFKHFFRDANITKAPALPATKVGKYSYQYMFDNTQITKAPELPATTLAINCYENMFWECEELIYSPTILPATELADFCYQNMFMDCPNLETAPELPATTLPNYSPYANMLNKSRKLTEIKCYATNLGSSTSNYWLPYDLTGVFYKNPDCAVPSRRGSATIPSNMTVVDWIK